MAHRLLKTIGAAWLGVALTACGTQGSSGEEVQAPEQERSGEDIQSTLNALGGAQVVGVHADGIPDSIQGELGRVARTLNTLDASRQAVASVAPAFRLNADDMVLRKSRTDEMGNQHLRFTQTKNGLEVVGGELVVHVRPDGSVYGANGSARDGLNVSALPRIAAASAREAALSATVGTGLEAQGAPRLVYVRTEEGALRLAYEVTVTGENNLMPLRDRVYVSAQDGSVVLRAPQIHSALNRKVYSANNGTSTPGTLKRSEGQAATGDSHVDINYDMLGYTYDCYKVLFNRDSLDNAGATLISTVHYSTNYVNAYWDGTQMVYGDGNGVDSIELGKDADVTVHELTHAVTEYESNLTYSGQSGGLNEAMSDTFGAVCESRVNNWSTAPAIWMVGEDVWTPGTANDALRYMDDPAKDGVSKDWAPNVTSGTDVHYSSGVPNLAFALLSKGGTHPRGRSTVNVPAIGVEKAARIWYYANTNLFTASTTFVQAKNWTVQAAAALGYTAAEQAAVTAAWEAVGVGVTVPPPTSTPLTNGTAVTVSDSTGNNKYYSLVVPAGATALTFTISGGTGDADLYVKFGAVPDSATYDCRPYQSGNAETCTITNIQAGTYYVMLNAYSAYSNVTLKGSYTPGGGGGGNVLQNNVPVTGISGASGSFTSEWITVDVPASRRVTFSIAGGSGDADMFVKFGSSPTTASYDCRPYLSGNNESCSLTKTTQGKYYVKIRGYTAYSGVTLKAVW
ncbi:bacillolysin [Corallococcus coralloides DSM 2259]|uniref:Bacillolysin n=1 Tax=Corallococcus coralloides (strain ATCC 25202 / DSM 2259 / NBRC 100086 / M2) TaxID=1144275 RepID=H8MG54_CORCM|nr:M4 family metallopeptidase [Corallococcus coralloides]AFE08782.1 bacillolysin [Corallococcus coralloides DSM 2259]